ncbi:hypothetical protein C8J57DRAFT_1616054 [Mycena rebaudengoi]|nr:hypothetical protein C8J57DRAFT_1616054 [Mycena rebaudengoi]
MAISPDEKDEKPSIATNSLGPEDQVKIEIRTSKTKEPKCHPADSESKPQAPGDSEVAMLKALLSRKTDEALQMELKLRSDKVAENKRLSTYSLLSGSSSLFTSNSSPSSLTRRFPFHGVRFLFNFYFTLTHLRRPRPLIRRLLSFDTTAFLGCPCLHFFRFRFWGFLVEYEAFEPIVWIPNTAKNGEGDSESAIVKGLQNARLREANLGSILQIVVGIID